MDRIFKQVVVFLILLFAFSAASAQLRMPTAPVQKEEKPGGPKNFIFQIEPAITFPEGLSTTVAGTNLSILLDVLQMPLPPDSVIEIQGRMRFTTGFWHFSKKFQSFFYEWRYKDGWIPVEAGFDMAFAYNVPGNSGISMQVVPYLGLQFGMGIHVYGDNSGVDLIDTIRLGTDIVLNDKYRIGVAYIFNGIIFDDVEYNQIGISFGI